jgi:hypothetical protein
MSATPYSRFLASMSMDLDRWRDGCGHDLAALAEATDAEREAIESLLLSRPTEDWRDVEALALLDSPRARDRLLSLAHGSHRAIALAVIAYAPHLVDRETTDQQIVAALDHGEQTEVVARAIDLAERFPTPCVIEALIRALARADRPTAYDLIATLLTIQGTITDLWDLTARPMILSLLDDLTASDPVRSDAARNSLRARCSRPA